MNSTTLDITTIHAATNAVVQAMESAVCQWEQQCEDAVQDGNLTIALMYRNWAFAADLMAKTAVSTLSTLMVQSINQSGHEVCISVPSENHEANVIAA
jgi:hypothetical protein